MTPIQAPAASGCCSPSVGPGCEAGWCGCKARMELAAMTPVVSVPVLSNATVLHVCTASNTFALLTRMSLDQTHSRQVTVAVLRDMQALKQCPVSYVDRRRGRTV